MSRQPRHSSARTRGRARRRLRYLRRLRELQLRDLGGFVFDLFRFGEQREPLVRAKLDALIATDKEILALREVLGQAGDERTLPVRVPGVGGSCAVCGAFHSSTARFCDSCGADLAQGAPPAVAELAPPQDTEAVPLPPADAGAPAAEPAPVLNGEVTATEAAEAAVEDVAAQPETQPEPEPEPETPFAPPDLPAAAPQATGDAEDAPREIPSEPDAPDGPDPTGEIAAVGPRRVREGRTRRRRGSSR
ncbi:MAG: hypothetical protein QOE65_1031 [Solirubrobacteraceae bacterium]|nr:hypothetical protein [Solirubrobacteraceae bacterium]